MELKDPVNIIRNIIAFGCLAVMFFNLYDCLIGSKSMIHYVATVGFFIGAFLYMLLSKGHMPIVIVLIITATITMLYDTRDNNLSYATVFFIFAMFLERDIKARLIVYFITIVIILCVAIFHTQSNADFINYLIAYIIIYGLSELVYLEMSNRFKRKE